MGKKKAATKTRRKTSADVPAGGGALENGAGKGATKGSAHRSIANQRLRKLAKKHRPPDEYFAGNLQRPW